jgi:hypothetical protein
MINKWNQVALQATDKQGTGFLGTVGGKALMGGVGSGLGSGIAGGIGGGSSSGSGSSTMTPAQEEQYKRLLAMADQFADSGGFAGQGNEFLDQSKEALSGMGEHFKNVLTGDADTEALEGALNAQQSVAQQGLDKSIAGVGTQAQLSGGGGGSRQGIAEGVAVGESNAALQNVQAGTINEFAQQEQARKMGAAQGLGGVAKGFQGLQEGLTSDADNMMKTLMAYQSLISGNMGGTTDTSQEEESSGKFG